MAKAGSTITATRQSAAGVPAPRRTPEERAGQGKAVRVRVPRDSHAMADMPADRADPVSLLERQAQSRVPDLVPVRYGRMLVSPFTFFRGAALPMASDLARTPVSGLKVQACGDAHLSNFGIFGSPERRLMFDVNDFDETLPGPWEWDVKRLAASMEVASRENGLSRKQRRAVVLATVGRYREAMREFAGYSNLRVFYTRIDVEQIRDELGSRLTSRQRKKWDQGQAKARSADSMRDLKKLTRMVDGERRIVADPPLIVPLEDMAADMDPDQVHVLVDDLITKYRRTLQPDRRLLLDQYQLTDMAHKVVGVGSVGTRCFIALMLGRDHRDPLFLQVKEAQESVLAPFAGASRIANEGQRVVTGQRLMQAAGDSFLGWSGTKSGMDGESRHFYVRQLRDWKYSVEIADLAPDGLRLYGELCGWTLARAHARSGDRVAIAAYLGGSDVFDQAIAEFAASYADQNERDHRALAEAAASGRITAVRDV
jgi:uncharacterized protein (DUF2252 family)